MSVRSRQEPRSAELMATVLFLILGLIGAFVFLYYYSARAAVATVERQYERAEKYGQTQRMPPPDPAITAPGRMEHAQKMHAYLTQGDKQAKQWLIREEQVKLRAQNRLLIWGGLVVACIGFVVAARFGLPLLRSR